MLENDRARGRQSTATAAAAAAESVPPPSSCSPASVLALALTAVVAGAGYLFRGGDTTPWGERLTQCPELSALASAAGHRRCATSRSSRAADILQAQQLLLPQTNTATDQASMTPAWVVRRDPYFGLWLWPRLKLVLFACPKCGNSEVRELLNDASAEVEKNEEEDMDMGHRGDDVGGR